jgi:DNA-binding CsgD family transcriptional regulator
MNKNKKVITKDVVCLTKRETEIMYLLLKEYTTIDIANELSINQRTVEGHKLKLAKKLGVRTTVGIIVYGLKAGLIKI